MYASSLQSKMVALWATPGRGNSPGTELSLIGCCSLGVCENYRNRSLNLFKNRTDTFGGSIFSAEIVQDEVIFRGQMSFRHLVSKIGILNCKNSQETHRFSGERSLNIVTRTAHGRFPTRSNVGPPGVPAGAANPWPQLLTGRGGSHYPWWSMLFPQQSQGLLSHGLCPPAPCYYTVPRLTRAGSTG